MRCAKCSRFSLAIICTQCEQILSQYEQGCRLVDGLKVYYFYKYRDIKEIILSKHNLYGSFAISRLAQLCMAKFANEFSFGSAISVVPLDDITKGGYSHTAILAKSLKNTDLQPVYRAIRATNSVKYAGKSLEFRQKNPRGFKLLKKIDNPVILVDDIITTGATIAECATLLRKAGCDELYAATVATRIL